MGKQKQDQDEQDEARRDDADEPEVATQEADAPPIDEDPLSKAERERDEYLAQWQRAKADYANLKRRTFQDIQAAVKRDQILVLGDMLQVLDYLDMALASPCENQDAKNLLVGVQMTRDQLWSALERSGVAPITVEGVFDPDRHQAVATVTSRDLEPGQVVEVVRSGFLIGTDVLRHAHVKVSAAPAEETPEGAADPAPPTDEA